MNLTVAFASSRHAREALRFLEASSLSVGANERPMEHETDLAVVDIEVPRRQQARLRVLIQGVHGLIIDEEHATETSVG